MRKIDIAALFLFLTVVFGSYIILIDDILGTRNSMWFEQAEKECFKDLSHPDMPPVQAAYILIWRLLDNFPTICDTLAPSPDLGKRVPLTVVTEQDYYYRCWYNVTIVVNVPTVPRIPIKTTRGQLPL